MAGASPAAKAVYALRGKFKDAVVFRFKLGAWSEQSLVDHVFDLAEGMNVDCERLLLPDVAGASGDAEDGE